MGTRKPKRPRIDIREKFAQRQQGGEAGDSDDSDDSGNNSSSSSGGFATGGKLKKQGEDDKKKKSKNKKDDDDDDDEEEEEAYFSDGIHSKPKGKPCRRKWKARRKKKEAKCVDDEIRNLGFCCEVCTCDQDKMEELLPPGSSEGFVHTFVKSQEENLWHRRCCHEALDNDSNWVTLYDEVREEATEANAKVKEITQEKKEKKNSSSSSSNSAAGVELEWVTDVEIQKAYEVSKRQESELYNSDGLEDPQWKLSSHPDYNAAVEEPFEAHRRRCLEGAPQGRKPAVVVDAFGNIGTAIIVLKRLCIDISKIIHIEHDKVATHVSRYNHDITYNPNLPRQDGDSIEHVYYSTWEEFQQNLEPIMKEHGPFDIIIGGPPCYDYTKVNARREGHEGEQGQYMLDFGRTIREIERYQQPHLLYFLAENVRLSGKDKQEVMDAFGLDWDPIELDAKYLSPCRRDRHWFTNIPFRYLDCQSPVSLQGPESCLEDGYSIPAHIVDPNTTAKANCIMGSKSRIDERDSLRMYVFQTKPRIHKNQIVYRGRPMTISEREKLMGYPDQYVEKAVKELFNTLIDQGHNMQLDPAHFLDEYNMKVTSWKEELPEKYHTFAGNYHKLPCSNPHRFEVAGQGHVCNGGNERPVLLKLAPPCHRGQPVFYNAEAYSKHLIGLAFSVPVVEHFLRPLQDIFAVRKYEGYSYRYAWEIPAETSPARPIDHIPNVPKHKPKQSQAQAIDDEDSDDMGWLDESDED